MYTVSFMSAVVSSIFCQPRAARFSFFQTEKTFPTLSNYYEAKRSQVPSTNSHTHTHKNDVSVCSLADRII